MHDSFYDDRISIDGCYAEHNNVTTEKITLLAKAFCFIFSAPLLGLPSMLLKKS